MAMHRCLPPVWAREAGYAVCVWNWVIVAPLPRLGQERPATPCMVDFCCYSASYPIWARVTVLATADYRHLPPFGPAKLSGLELSYFVGYSSSPAPPPHWAGVTGWPVWTKWSTLDQVVHTDRPLESGLSVPTLRGYVAAISSRHRLVDGLTMGTQSLVSCFLREARRLCPPRGRLIPAWDLRVVLDALTEPPFELLSGLGLELLSLKVVFILPIASVKRGSELCALSVHPACLRLGGEGSAISLLRNLAFLLKVLPRSFVARPLVLDPFHPPPHESLEVSRLHLVCPVRALRGYIARTSSVRQSDQLCACFGGSVRGQAVSKQWLARWVVRAIELAYSSAPPAGVVAHSTRGIVASWALFRGASLEEVCAAAGWASSLTFAKFYHLNVVSSVGGSFLQTAGPPWLFSVSPLC